MGATVVWAALPALNPLHQDRGFRLRLCGDRRASPREAGRRGGFVRQSGAMRSSLTVPVVAVVCAACGSGGRTLPFNELEPAIIEAVCHVNVLCEESPDQATCTASTTSQLGFFPTMKVDIAAGTVKYDARAAHACVETFSSVASCTLTGIAAVERSLDDLCGQVFTGTLPPGSTCFFNEECANRGRCDRPSCVETCCAGTCVARTIVQAGGDCSAADAECVAGTGCGFTDTTFTQLVCKPLLPAGAACTTADTCVSPYACVTPDPLVNAGTCTAPPGHGEPCGTSAAVSSICNDLRDSCDPNTGVCSSAPPVGGACEATGPSCAGGAICDGTTCIARGGPGATCDPAGVAPCLGDLQCDTTNHCTLPPVGVSCR